MSILFALFAAGQTVAAAPRDQIQITSKMWSFSCEARSSAGRVVKFDGTISEFDWKKYEKNDSGVIDIKSTDPLIPAGVYMAVARNRDISFSNYLYDGKRPTRMALLVGDNGEAIVSIESKVSEQGKLKPDLYAGFCKGDLAGIGAI